MNYNLSFKSFTIKGCCSLLFFIVFSCNKTTDFYKLPLYSSNGVLNVVIEIPAGTNKKFEYNVGSNTFEIDQKDGKDRVVNYLPYLGNYGYFPSTYSDPEKGGDGDAIDVLLISESVPTGSVIEVIPIGVVKLIDDGELDYKIVAVPYHTDKQIISATSYNELSLNYPEIKQIIELWFLNYNKDDVAKIDGWGDQEEAITEIKRYEKKG
jgi:inorganic pyrophosphatase